MSMQVSQPSSSRMDSEEWVDAEVDGFKFKKRRKRVTCKQDEDGEAHPGSIAAVIPTSEDLTAKPLWDVDANMSAKPLWDIDANIDEEGTTPQDKAYHLCRNICERLYMSFCMFNSGDPDCCVEVKNYLSEFLALAQVVKEDLKYLASLKEPSFEKERDNSASVFARKGTLLKRKAEAEAEIAEWQALEQFVQHKLADPREKVELGIAEGDAAVTPALVDPKPLSTAIADAERVLRGQEENKKYLLNITEDMTLEAEKMAQALLKRVDEEIFQNLVIASPRTLLSGIVRK